MVLTRMIYLHDAGDAHDVLGHLCTLRAVPLLVELQARVQDPQHPAGQQPSTPAPCFIDSQTDCAATAMPHVPSFQAIPTDSAELAVWQR